MYETKQKHILHGRNKSTNYSRHAKVIKTISKCASLKTARIVNNILDLLGSD